MTFHYRIRHCPPDPGYYGFAVVRWTLDAIGILLISAAMLAATLLAIVLASTIQWG